MKTSYRDKAKSCHLVSSQERRAHRILWMTRSSTASRDPGTSRALVFSVPGVECKRSCPGRTALPIPSRPPRLTPLRPAPLRPNPPRPAPPRPAEAQTYETNSNATDHDIIFNSLPTVWFVNGDLGAPLLPWLECEGAALRNLQTLITQGMSVNDSGLIRLKATPPHSNHGKTRAPKSPLISHSPRVREAMAMLPWSAT